MITELRRILTECQETGELVAFNKWRDYHAVLVGIVRTLDDEEVTFDRVDVGGVAGEPLTIRLENIHSLERGGVYMAGLRYLFDNRERLGLKKEKGKRAKSAKRIRKVLAEAIAASSPVRIKRDKDKHNLECLPLALGDEWVRVHEIRDGGVLDAVHVFPLEDIERVEYGSLNQIADAALLAARASGDL